MEITFPALQTINTGVSTAYNTQFDQVETVYQAYTSELPSTGDFETYPRLDMIPGLREWLGERIVHSLSIEAFSIKNKTFEGTISINREQFEDDKFGLLTMGAQTLAMRAKRLPDLLPASLLVNGHNAIGIANQHFFDTAHPNFGPAGQVTTASNYIPPANGVTSPSWYLMMTTEAQKPLIYQMRRPYVLNALISLTDQNVFFRKEFVWGVDGRSNAGYGLWQYALRCDAPLNLVNLLLARSMMAQWRLPDGTPMGIRPDLLVVPSTLYPTAKAYCEIEYDPLAIPNLSPNTFRGMARALENTYLG